MKKTNLKRLVILVLILCVLPVAAFARTDYIGGYGAARADCHYRTKCVTTFVSSTTTRGSKTEIYSITNNKNYSDTVSFSHSETESWSLSLGNGVKKDWIELSAGYGGNKQDTCSIQTKLAPHKRITFYKQKVTVKRKFKTVKQEQHAWYVGGSWINDGKPTTVYTTETHVYWDFSSSVTNAN